MSKVFISYSHKDEKWKDMLVSQLRVLEKEGLLEVWDDRRIQTGDDWYDEIVKAIESASVAVMLISADFLNSDFICKEEIPRILEQRATKGLRVIPVILRPCAWAKVKWLSGIQARPKDGKPIAGGNEYQQEVDMAAIAEEIFGFIEASAVKIDVSNQYSPPPSDNVYLSRLPTTSNKLVGREKELELLDNCWKNSAVNVISIVAWGGVGKTSLVGEWLNRIHEDSYRGAGYVYGWSFYSQGTSEKRQVSADEFISDALRFFGDPNPADGSPWDKGRRLAVLAGRHRSLIILDGLEPLQNPPGEQEGMVADPALKGFLKEIARVNKGLCIITTRVGVEDIKNLAGLEELPLEMLSNKAGAEVLKRLGAKGTDAELEQASEDYGGHALALTLLGNYVKVVLHGDIKKRSLIRKLTNEKKFGGHAARVMHSYEVWMKEKAKAELEILFIMGLFDRPADVEAVKEVMNGNVIEGLTSNLKELDNDDWEYRIYNLQTLGLILSDDGNKLDCHPIVREYFGERLKERDEDVWKEAHRRLYEYYKGKAKEYPDTMEEMALLYAAVAHGCNAGLYRDVLYKVYLERVNKKNVFYNTKSLGAFGADLSVLACFFKHPWSEPVKCLEEEAKAFMLSSVGFNLKALGRMNESLEAMEAAKEARVKQKNWENAAINCSNLSELYIVLGNLENAAEYARMGVAYANESGNQFQKYSRISDLAYSLFLQGYSYKASALFQEAEAMHKERHPNKHYLDSGSGFRYCQLLLEQKKYDEVLKRTLVALEIAEKYKWLLIIGLNCLSICRSWMAKGDFPKAEEYLFRAMVELRKAGNQDYIPFGLLARAEYFRRRDKFDGTLKDIDRAHHDLEEAFELSERCGMNLYLADCHLEYVRLYLAEGERSEARKHFEKAKKMIREMGYGLREKALQELEKALMGDI